MCEGDGKRRREKGKRERRERTGWEVRRNGGKRGRRRRLGIRMERKRDGGSEKRGF